jgi:hypothetical protein
MAQAGQGLGLCGQGEAESRGGSDTTAFYEGARASR